MPAGFYDGYPQAQRVADHLPDHQFPVQNVVIAGPDPGLPSESPDA